MKPVVILLLEQMSGGGAERNALALMRHLPEMGFTPVLVLRRGRGPLLGQVPAGVPVECLETGRQLSTGRLLFRLEQLIRRHRASILFSSLPWPNSLAAFRMALGSRSLVWVASEHNNPLIQFARYSAAIRFKRMVILKHFYRRAASIVCVSEGLRTALSGITGLPLERFRTINNPIEMASSLLPDTEARDEYLGRNEPMHLLCCGRLHHQKGFDVVLRALAQVQTRPVPHLTILGGGPEETVLRRLRHELGLDDQVTLPGFVDSPWQEMRKADIFVLGSRWEGFGNVLVEAMASGLPVISTDCEFGPGEIIQHDVNGVLVPPEDPVALARAIDGLIADPQRAGRLGRAGQLRADDFSVDKKVREYADLFRELLADG